MVAPKLRFKEFNNDWSLKKLGDLSFKPQYGMNSSATEFDGENKYLRITDINEDDHSFNFSKLTSPADDLDDKYLLKNGDLLFARTGASVGKSYLYNSKDGKVYFAGFLIKFSLQTEVNPYFIFSQTLSKKFQNWVITNSMRSGQPGINAEEYSLLPISFTSLKEQTKIATFLAAVDEKITQLTQKHQLLSQYKQGMMQKLFSQQIRFKADDGSEFGEWENISVKEIFDVTRGQVLAVSNTVSVADTDYKYPVFSSQTKQKGLMGFYKKYLFEDALTWTTDGANAGDVNFRKGKFYCTNVCGVLLSKKGYANLCIAEILNKVTHKYVSYVGNPKLMNNVMSEIPITIPSNLEEQTKIANFLSAIDQKIEVTEQQIEQAKQWKKGLLQQMFV